MSDRPAVIYLIGFPGAGKLTIATEMSRQTDGRLVVIDNHLINNPIFAVVRADGRSSLSAGVWEATAEVRRVVLGAIRELAAPETSFVFTNVLIAGHAWDESAIGQIAAIAEARSSVFVPVLVDCQVEELARRVTNPRRRERLKMSDADRLREMAATSSIVTTDHPNTLKLDVTNLTPDVAAARILNHATSIGALV